MRTAFVFPGQGSQTVGMGAALAAASRTARDVLAEVDEALGQKLSALMAEGPAETLTLTENAQPAIMAASLAVVRALEVEFGLALETIGHSVAGHSLGEYSALCAAGGFDLATTARLLKLRGQAMQAAVPVGEGAMAALLGLDMEAVKAVAAEASALGVCAPANDNAPGQVVISGRKAAIEHAIELAKARGGKRALLLPVSAPFHCALMQPAADRMAEALAAHAPAAPRLPLVCNVTAAPTQDPEAIRALLVEQVTGMVRWRESVETLAQLGVTRIVECGAGKVLTGLVKRIAPDIETVNLESIADLEAFAKTC